MCSMKKNIISQTTKQHSWQDFRKCEHNYITYMYTVHVQYPYSVWICTLHMVMYVHVHMYMYIHDMLYNYVTSMCDPREKNVQPCIYNM